MPVPKPASLAGPTLAPSTTGHSHAVAEEVVDQPKLLAALRGVRAGDFDVRLPLDWTGVPGSISEVFNEVVGRNQRLSREFADLTQLHVNVRAQLGDLTEMARDRDLVLTAVGKGDLSQRVALDVDSRPLEGAFLRSGQVVNSMIQTLAVFADQVTTVAREVGTQGKLGGQAQVTGVNGTWKSLTEIRI